MLKKTGIVVLVLLLFGCTKDIDFSPQQIESSRIPCDSITIAINEFVARGSNDVPPGSIEGEDWFELINNTDLDFNIAEGEWFVSDDNANLEKFGLPACSLASKGLKLIWCSGLDGEIEGEIHTNFKLSGSGDALYLSAKQSGTIQVVDSIIFGEQSSGLSYGKKPNACGLWKNFTNTTPGRLN